MPTLWRFRPLILPLTIGLLLLLPACDQQNNTEAMAEGLCTCMAPLAQSMVHMEAGVGLEGVPDAESLLAQIDSLMNMQVSPCLDALETKYGAQLQDQEDALRQSMLRQCPEVVEAMNRAAGTTPPLR